MFTLGPFVVCSFDYANRRKAVFIMPSASVAAVAALAFGEKWNFALVETSRSHLFLSLSSLGLTLVAEIPTL